MKKYYVFAFVLIFISISLFAENDRKVPIKRIENSTGLAPFSQARIRHEEPVTSLRQETAYGNDVSADNWYSLDTGTMGATTISPVTYACFSGDYGLQGFFAIDYNTDNLLQIDPATGAETIIGNMPCPLAGSGGIWSDLCCDKATGNWYAIAVDLSVNAQLYSVDITNAGITWVADFISTGTISGAVDQNGLLYTLDIVTDSTYETDLSTYITTLLGSAGINANYAQGAAYEPVDDIFYFAAYSTGAELRTLDRATGMTTFVGALPGETGAFGFPGSLAEPGAPAVPTDVFVIPDAGGALIADIDWVCPTLQVNGDPLTDLDEMRVYRDDVLIYTDSAPVIGGPGSYTDVSVPLAGQYTYKVVGYNDFGEGIPASIGAWIGEDVPAAVTGLTLTDVSTRDLMAQLDWVNPTTGLHGGYFPGVTGYDIVRSDAATFTIGGPVTQWIDDTIVNPGIYWYSVTPFNNSGPGPSTQTPSVGIGITVIEVGNAETTDYQIPMNIFYENSITECVYDKTWIGTDMLINTVAYHTAGISSTINPFNLEVWIGEIDVDDLTGGWIDGSQLTQVYTGAIDVPTGDYWLEIPLDTPFEYTYTYNLVIMIIKDDDQWFSTSDVWWTTESGTPCRTLHEYSDYDEFYAMNPPASPNDKSTYPDMRFYYSELAHGDVEGVVTDNVTTNPIEGAEVYIGSWGPATTNSLGEYLLEDMVTGIQDVTATKEGYYDFFGSVEVLADVVVTYDIGMDPFEFATLNGNVTDVDTSLPIENADIYMISDLGYEYWATTNASGDYSIVDIVADTYDITCTAAMYIPQTVQDIVFDPGANIILDFALQISIYYFSDFEDNDGYLLSNNPSGWQWGAPTSGPGSAHSGTNVWGTVLGGAYANNANWTLDTTIPVGVVSTAYMLEFWHWYDIETSYDGGNVKVSTDGGTSWSVITPLTGYPGTANTANPLNGEPIFCGHDQGFWELVEFDLSAYVGENILVRWHFGSDGSVTYPGWYIDDVRIYEQAFGSLEGFVMEFGTTNPIADADITIGLYSGTSGADGYYIIDGIVTGTYDVECEHEYYLPALVEDVVIEATITTTQNINMLWSEIAVNVTELTSYLPPDETEVQTFIITNDGPGDLEYNITFDFPAEVRVRNGSRNNSTTSRNSSTSSRVNINTSNQHIIWETNNSSEDRDPNASSYTHGTPPTDDPGDIIFDIDVQALTGDDQCLGAEYVSPYLWVTGGGGTGGTVENSIYKIDPVAGTLEATYLQNTTSAWGMRDLCYDPVTGLLYAGDDNGFYSIDPADGTVTTVFTGAIGSCIRALAYDGTHFWTKSFGDPIYEFDIAGNIINSYTDALSTYGMAYDSFENCLWLFASPTTFFQYDLNGAATGTSYAVILPNGGIIGGAFYDEGGLVPGKTVLGCLGQGTPDVVYAMELRDAATWVLVTNNISGTVPGNGGFIVVEVTFDATDLTIGEVLTADLLIHNNANYIATRGDDYVIPVTLTVTGFIPPSNLYVDPATWLFTWDAPPGPNLLGYNVFLDGDPEGTTTATEWQYEDLVVGQAYVAGVSAVYDDGESIVMEYPFAPVDAGDIIPLVTKLCGNFPNPFNPDTQIAFSLNKQSHVQITIYNVRGQLVRTLVDEQRDANNYTVTWNGTDDNRKSVSSGIYFYKMKAEKYASTKKMILMK